MKAGDFFLLHVVFRVEAEEGGGDKVVHNVVSLWASTELTVSRLQLAQEMFLICSSPEAGNGLLFC